MFIYDISKVPANKRKLQSRQSILEKMKNILYIKWYGHKVEDSFYTDIYYMNEIFIYDNII